MTKNTKFLLMAWCFTTFTCTYELEHSILDTLFLPSFRVWRLKTFNEAVKTINNTERQLRKLHTVQNEVDGKVPFPCQTKNTRSTIRPTSVHKLRPGDIDVVGAIGDSLTAGTALGSATLTLDALAYEDRGRSFSIGGQDTWRRMVTLPNILKEFNPKLIGHSLGPSLTIQRASQFNVGENGAISDNMPYMASVLVERMTKDPRVQIDRDWKVVTFMIGDNDFCSEICYKKESHQEILNKHRLDLVQTLRVLRDNLPRTFVNLVPPPSLLALSKVKKLPFVCEYFLRSFQCPCLFGLAYRHLRESYFELMRRWQNVDIEVASDAEFDREDFTVVAQPFFLDANFPNDKPLSYLAVDCFHFSQKGGAGVANSLWNNMLEPIGKKSTHFSRVFEIFKCPSKDKPYLYTRRNSDYE